MYNIYTLKHSPYNIYIYTYFSNQSKTKMYDSQTFFHPSMLLYCNVCIVLSINTCAAAYLLFISFMYLIIFGSTQVNCLIQNQKWFKT